VNQNKKRFILEIKVREGIIVIKPDVKSGLKVEISYIKIEQINNSSGTGKFRSFYDFIRRRV